MLSTGSSIAKEVSKRNVFWASLRVLFKGGLRLCLCDEFWKRLEMGQSALIWGISAFLLKLSRAKAGELIVRVAVLVEKSRAYGRALCEGIAAEAAAREGWELRLIDGDGAREIERLSGFDGLIVRILDDAAAEAVRQKGVPAVDIFGLQQYEGIPLADSDHVAVGRLAARNFLARRFRHFAYCGYEGVRFSDARGDAFKAELAGKGFSCERFTGSERPSTRLLSRIINHEQVDLGVDARRLMRWLEDLPKPVAIFCCHDIRAYQVAVLCRTAELAVPGQVAVLGVDNDTLLCGFTSPSLSSIDPNAFEVGRQAVRLLAARMADADVKAVNVLVPPRGLTERRSTEVFPVEPRWLSDALLFINRNYTRGITANEVFDFLKLSHTLVESVFRTTLGTTVKQEIIRLRLEEAVRLLKTSSLSIEKISEASGFSSPQYFNNSFRAAFGLSPDRYRRADAGSNC